MADENTDTSNNETGEDTGIKPEDLYDDEGESEDETKGNDGEKTDDKLTDDKEGEGEEDDKGETEGAPEKYDLKLADDSLLDQNDMDRLETYSKELDLNNEDAQLMAGLESEAIGRYQDRLDKNVEDIQTGWLKDAEKDKEIGGDAFKENVELSHRVLDKFGSKELTTLLEDSSLGNHPEVIRIFSKIGKLMSSDRAVFSKEHGSGEKTLEETFYGSPNDN